MALPEFFCAYFSLGIPSISFCGFIFTWQAFSGELYGRPLFPPLTFSERTPGEAKSSLIISQAGSVPLLYLSANLISQEWKVALLQWAREERPTKNQNATTTKNQCGQIHGHIWKKLIYHQLKKGCHWEPVIFILFTKVMDQKCPCLSSEGAFKDVLGGSQAVWKQKKI